MLFLQEFKLFQHADEIVEVFLKAGGINVINGSHQGSDLFRGPAFPQVGQDLPAHLIDGIGVTRSRVKYKPGFTNGNVLSDMHGLSIRFYNAILQILSFSGFTFFCKNVTEFPKVALLEPF
jgi:hypothetical protein